MTLINTNPQTLYDFIIEARLVCASVDVLRCMNTEQYCCYHNGYMYIAI